jgi:hypothetical protein
MAEDVTGLLKELQDFASGLVAEGTKTTTAAPQQQQQRRGHDLRASLSDYDAILMQLETDLERVDAVTPRASVTTATATEPAQTQTQGPLDDVVDQLALQLTNLSPASTEQPKAIEPQKETTTTEEAQPTPTNQLPKDAPQEASDKQPPVPSTPQAKP